jgi:serine protease Do
VAQARHSLVHVRNGRAGAGAGTIWHPDGLILTNAHVAGRRHLEVTLPDGRILPARLLARDASRDVAALGVEARGLPAAELGDSLELRPGQWVLAVGHPWGVAGAATAGVVAGVGRRLPEMPRSDRPWIAVSLHLRPGHSGGPLVDAAGRLVGINTMMAGPDVGLAVPVHEVKRFLREAVGV